MKIKNGLQKLIDDAKETVLLGSQIELLGSHEALIQGQRGIIEYNVDTVRVKLIDQEVTFWGQELTISCLSQDSIELKGKIQRIEFS